MGLFERDHRGEKRGWARLAPSGPACRLLLAFNAFVLGLLFLCGESLLADVALFPTSARAGQTWRIFTYGFFHDAWAPLLWSSLFLWWIASDLEYLYGSREFFLLFLAATSLAGVVHFGVSVARGANAPLVGSTAGLAAAVTVYACHFPRHWVRVIAVRVPVVALAAAYAVGALCLTPTDALPASLTALLAGIAFGLFFYKKQLRFADLWPQRPAPSVSAPLLAQRASEEQMASVAVVAAPVVRSEATDDRSLDERVDAVLEKMSRCGKDSLTEGDRRILSDASERYRRRRS